MSQNQFPAGWDQHRVSSLIAHYEDQSEDEAIAEDEASSESQCSTWVEVPLELVSAVRDFIQRHAQAS